MNRSAVGNLVGLAGFLIFEGGVVYVFGFGWAALVGGIAVFSLGYGMWAEANGR